MAHPHPAEESDEQIASSLPGALATTLIEFMEEKKKKF